MLEEKPKKRRRRKRAQSFGERDIEDYLLANQIEYEREKTFDDCLSRKRRNLRFDFFLPSYNLLVEFQGRHHYEPVNKKKNALYTHKKTVLHDGIKKIFAAENNIKLLEIGYVDRDKIVEILNQELGLEYVPLMESK
jgi:hypothetical protein